MDCKEFFRLDKLKSLIWLVLFSFLPIPYYDTIDSKLAISMQGSYEFFRELITGTGRNLNMIGLRIQVLIISLVISYILACLIIFLIKRFKK